MRDTAQKRERKSLEWVGSSLKDLEKFPQDVQDEIGDALYSAQIGDKHPKAKPLKGREFSGVMEIRSNDASGTYRAVYTTKIGDKIYYYTLFKRNPKGALQHPRKKSISSNADCREPKS